MGELDQNPYIKKKWYRGNLYLLMNNSKKRLDGSLLYQWKYSLWIKSKLASLSVHAFPSRKMWETLNLISHHS